MRARLAVALVGGLAALTACGTTVPLSQQVQTGGDALAPGALGGGPSPSTTGGGTTGADAVGTGAAIGGSAGASAVDGTSTGTGGMGTTGAGDDTTGTTTGTLANVPGVTATTIRVGVYTAAGYSSFASSVGFNVALGDQAAEAKQVIGYINDHGGILGRKIVPVIHDANIALAAQNPGAEYEAACADWTQDNRVYAVVSPIGTGTNTMYDCLSRAGVPTITAGESQDSSFFQRYPNWVYEPTDMNLRRILSNNVDALAGAGFFGSKAKIGVILGDVPQEHLAVDQGLRPALARHGLRLADSFAVPAGTSGTSAYSSAVLRFQAEGITHVLFTFIGSPLLFMENAENQQYRPRYGLHSRTSPAAVLQGNAPAKQQHGAMGIGWQPMNDVDSAHDPGSIGPRQKLCIDLIRKSGQDPSVRATALIGLWLCDNLLFLRDALQHAPSLAIAGLRAGAESLGPFDAASTFRSSFAPGRLHDGAGAYRLFAYKDDCSCYQYVSPLRPAA